MAKFFISDLIQVGVVVKPLEVIKFHMGKALIQGAIKYEVQTGIYAIANVIMDCRPGRPTRIVTFLAETKKQGFEDKLQLTDFLKRAERENIKNYHYTIKLRKMYIALWYVALLLLLLCGGYCIQTMILHKVSILMVLLLAVILGALLHLSINKSKITEVVEYDEGQVAAYWNRFNKK